MKPKSIVSSLWGTPFLRNAKTEKRGREHRLLKLENLEARQMLSVSPLGVDVEDTSAIVSTEAPVVTQRVYAADLVTEAADGTISATNVRHGEALEISCEVTNEGNTWARDVKVTFYASTDSTDITSGTVLGTVSQNGISNGKSKTFTLSLDAFPELAAGDYFIGWVVEGRNDSDTTNNTAVLADLLNVSEMPDIELLEYTVTPVDHNNNGMADWVYFDTTLNLNNPGYYRVTHHLRVTGSDGVVHTSNIGVQNVPGGTGESSVFWSYESNGIYNFMNNAGLNPLDTQDTQKVEYEITVRGDKDNDGMFETHYLAAVQTLDDVVLDRSLQVNLYDREITDSINESANTLDVIFEVAPRYYDVHALIQADLYDSQGNFVDHFQINLDLDGWYTHRKLALSFDYAKVVENGVNGPFSVKNFKLIQTNGTEDTSDDAILLDIEDFYTTSPYDVAFQIVPSQNGNEIVFDCGKTIVEEPGTFTLSYKRASSRWGWKTVKVDVADDGSLSAAVKSYLFVKGRTYDLKLSNENGTLAESQLTVEKLRTPNVTTSKISGDFDAMNVTVKKFDENASGVAVSVRTLVNNRWTDWSDWTQVGTRDGNGVMQFTGFNGITITPTATEGVYYVSGLPNSSTVTFRLMATGGVSANGETLYQDSATIVRREKLARQETLTTPNITVAAVKGETEAMLVTVKSVDKRATGIKVTYSLRENGRWSDWSGYLTPKEIEDSTKIQINDLGNGQYKVTGLPAGATIQMRFQAFDEKGTYKASQGLLRQVTLAQPMTLKTPSFGYTQSKGFYNFRADSNAAGYELQYRLPKAKQFETLDTLLTEGQMENLAVETLLPMILTQDIAGTYTIGRRYSVTLKVTAKAADGDTANKDSSVFTRNITFTWTQDLKNLFFD